jgi:hypothetical protein
MILALALVLFVLAGPRLGIKASVVAVLVVAGVGALLYLLSQWPSIRGMPADPLVKAVNAVNEATVLSLRDLGCEHFPRRLPFERLNIRCDVICRRPAQRHLGHFWWARAESKQAV